MAYKRKYETKEELSAALSRAAKSRKNIHNCGRKRKVDAGDNRSTSIYVRSCDRDVFTVVAAASGISIVELMHKIAQRLQSSRAELFRNNGKNS